MPLVQRGNLAQLPRVAPFVTAARMPHAVKRRHPAEQGKT
jgi:hypothetical protein